MGRKSKNILGNSSYLICKGTVESLSFEIHIADIFTLESEGLVNPANKRLDHAGGLAAVISSLAGKEFSEECDRHLKYKRALNPGEMLVTDSYKLKDKGIKKIINVVGEVIEGNRASPNQEKNLRETIRDCIIEAAKHNLKSVSLPAISCGIFRFPLDQAAKCHYEGFYSAAKLIKNKPLKVVRFALIQELEATEFSKCFLKYCENFTYFAYYDLPKNRGSHKYKYCGGCSGIFKITLFSLLSCCQNYCNFCVCRYQFKYCITCPASSVVIDVDNIVWCRECIQEVELTDTSKPLTCQNCHSMCSFHYNPGGRCNYCKTSY